MRIIRLEAENVKKLRAVAIEPTGNVVQITGANGSGKTSVLDCIWMALGGKDAVPSTPVRQGEESARITLDLGEFIVTRTFSAAGTTALKVTSPQGAVYGSPQTMLDKLLGSLSFDPLAFSRMKPREQRDQLATLAGLATMLDELDAAHKQDYEARTAVNRAAKQTAAQLAAMPAVDPCEPVVMANLVTALREAQHHNEQVNRERERRDAQARQIAAAHDKAAALRAEANRLLDEATTLAARAGEEQVALSKLPALAPLADVAAIERQFEEAERINGQARAYAERSKIAALLQEHEAEAQAITAHMAQREAERRRVIEAATFPIEGLGLSEEGVTYNGLPLEQASGAEQLRVSIAIAMATNPALRVLRIQDGSLLDERSLALIEAMAEAHDFQVWIEMVDTSGTVGIVMEDGTAHEAPAEGTPRRRRMAVGA